MYWQHFIFLLFYLFLGTDISLVDCRGSTPLTLAQSRLKHLSRNHGHMTLAEHSCAVEQVSLLCVMFCASFSALHA